MPCSREESCRRLLLAAILLIISFFTFFFKGRTDVRRDIDATFPFSEENSKYPIVKISGDVEKPGIYQCGANIVTHDAIKLAFLPGNPKTLYLLASQSTSVKNGMALTFKKMEGDTYSVSISGIPAHERILLGLPLDINDMSEKDFELLPLIGPALARRIVQYRQINGGKMNPEDLLSVEGIGTGKRDRLLKYFYPVMPDR